MMSDSVRESGRLKIARIGIFGGLMLIGKTIRMRDLTSPSEPLRLGLNSIADSVPLAFDEKGRTPFERVKADDWP
jgi:hypothetical protein